MARLWRALTDQEADQIRAVGINSPIVVAPNGIDVTTFDTPDRSSVSSRPSRPMRVVFLGRIHPKKGLDLLIPAWSSIGRDRRGWQLVIAGPDEHGYLSKVATAIRQHGIEDDVRIVGAVHGRSKAELLRTGDVFILPSHSEGFPVTVLEAMASRLPVIVTRTSNIAGITSNGAGIECDPNVGSISQSLRELLALTSTERQAMGRNGRAWVERDFTWPGITRTILAACEEHAL